MRVALLDANVLWPAAIRCTLIRAAIADLYRPAWTDQILAELAGALERDGKDPRFAEMVRASEMLRDAWFEE